MALPWLDTLLALAALDSPQAFLKDLIRVDKPSKAILPVFFHQADACLVTSNAFQVACELNPQLRKTLQVRATSPEVVTALFFFRRGQVSAAREQLELAIAKLHDSPAGIQVLTVFQCERMLKCPVACLDSTRELLRQRERLRPEHPTPNGSLSASPNRGPHSSKLSP
jgi:hypothetical protein